MRTLYVPIEDLTGAAPIIDEQDVAGLYLPDAAAVAARATACNTGSSTVMDD
jgi:hypothetical protein